MFNHLFVTLTTSPYEKQFTVKKTGHAMTLAFGFGTAADGGPGVTLLASSKIPETMQMVNELGAPWLPDDGHVLPKGRNASVRDGTTPFAPPTTYELFDLWAVDPGHATGSFTEANKAIVLHFHGAAPYRGELVETEAEGAPSALESL